MDSRNWKRQENGVSLTASRRDLLCQHSVLSHQVCGKVLQQQKETLALTKDEKAMNIRFIRRLPCIFSDISFVLSEFFLYLDSVLCHLVA